MRLAAHLSKARGQSVTVLASAGLTPGLSVADALSDLRSTTPVAPIGTEHAIRTSRVRPLRPSQA